MRKTIIFCLIAAALASAQQKRSVAVLPSVAENKALDPQGLILLTNKVRQIASEILPTDRFTLLRQDVIVSRIGEEELFRACKEGVCVAELTKNVGTDYGARCDIFKRDNYLLLQFELYSVRDEAIIGTFTEYRLKDFYAMLDLLDKRLPDIFRKMAAAAHKEQITYTVSLNSNGGSGASYGAKTVNAGSSVTLPDQGGLRRDGYAFGGWNTESSGLGTNYSANSSYTPAGNVTLYVKWNAVPAPAAPAAVPPPVRDVEVTARNTTAVYIPPVSNVSPAESRGIVSGNTLIDSRDGKKYRIARIGTLTWMAENLNYDVPNVDKDKCYGNNSANCDKYGRLYDWSTAKQACPAGWHLPSDAEWTRLTDYVGGSKKAGKKLKSTSGWNGKKGNGTDEHGFSALPGGFGNSGGDFYNAGYYGNWWSATEGSASLAWGRYMYYNNEGADRNSNDKTNLFSARCLQD